MSGVSRFQPSANPPSQNPQPAQNPPSTPKTGRALPQPKVQGQQQPAQGKPEQKRPPSPARERVIKLYQGQQVEQQGDQYVVTGVKVRQYVKVSQLKADMEATPETQKTQNIAATTPPLSQVVNKQPQTTAPSPRPERNAPPLQRNNSNIPTWGAKPSEQATKGFVMGVRAPEPPKPESKSTPNIPPKQAAAAAKPQAVPEPAKRMPSVQEKSQSTPSLSRANTTETSPTKQQLPKETTAKPAPASGLDERDSPSHSFELVRQDSQLSRQDSTLSRKDSISSAGSRTSLNPEADHMAKKIDTLLAKIQPHLNVPSGQKFKSENLRTSLLEIEKMLQEIAKKARDSQSKVLVSIIEGSQDIDPENPFQQRYENLKSTYAQINQILVDERFKQIQNEKIDPSAKAIKAAKLFAEFINKDEKDEFGMLTWLANKKIPDLASQHPDIFTIFAGKNNDPNVPYLVIEASKNIQNIKEADQQAETWKKAIEGFKNIPNEAEKAEKVTAFMKSVDALAAEKPILFAFMTKPIGFPRSTSTKQLQDMIFNDVQPIYTTYMANDPLALRSNQIKTITEALKSCQMDAKMVANFRESIFEDVASPAQKFQVVANMKTKADMEAYTRYLKQAKDILKYKYNGWHQDLSEALKKPEEPANIDKIKKLSEYLNSDDDRKLDEQRKILDTITNELKENGVLSKGTAQTLKQNQDQLLKTWPESSEKIKKFFAHALHVSTPEAISQSRKLNTLLEDIKGKPPEKPAKWLKNPAILPQPKVSDKPDFGVINEAAVAKSRKMSAESTTLNQLTGGKVMAEKYALAYNALLSGLSSFSATQTSQSGPNEQMKALIESAGTETSFLASLNSIKTALNTFPDGKAVSPYLDLYAQSIDAMAPFQEKYIAIKTSPDNQKLEQFINVYLSNEFQAYSAAIGELVFNSQNLEQFSKDKAFAAHYIKLNPDKLQGPFEDIIYPAQRMPRHGILAKTVQKTLTGKEKSAEDKRDLSPDMKTAMQRIDQATSYINKLQETRAYLTLVTQKTEKGTKEKLETNFEDFIVTMVNKDNLILTDNQYTTILNHSREAAIHHKCTVDEYKKIINKASEKLTALGRTNKDQAKTPIINSLKDALAAQLETVKDVKGSQLLSQVSVQATAQAPAPSSISFAELMKQANEFSTKPVTDKTADDMSKEYVSILSKVPMQGLTDDEYSQLMQTLAKPYRERISTVPYDELLEYALQAKEAKKEANGPDKPSLPIIKEPNIRQRLMQELNESTNPVVKKEAPPLTSPNAPLPAASPKTVRRGFFAQQPEPAQGRAGATPSRMRPQPEPQAAPQQSGRPLPTKPPQATTETKEARGPTPTSNRGRAQPPVPPPTAKPAVEKPKEQEKAPPQRPATPTNRFRPPWMK